MPTYEYSCVSCGASVEIVQRMTDPSLTTCEECGGLLKKVFHPAGIMFKGSGFYATDNRSKPKASAKASSDPAEQKSESKSESKSKKKSSEKSSSDGSGTSTSSKADKGAT